MYLSRVSLDSSNPSARHAIVNCNEMHRNLIRAFDVMDGEAAPRMEGAILYRLTCSRSGYEMLVMSRDLPDWQRLAQYGYVCAVHGTKDISQLRSVLIRDKVLRFALLASPSKKVASGGKNSRRVFLCTEKERAEWLKRQGEKYGFSLIGMREAALPFDVSGRKSGMEIQYRAVEFTGLLTITDEALFWKGYTEGVGPGKAYGLGLIVIARP